MWSKLLSKVAGESSKAILWKQVRTGQEAQPAAPTQQAPDEAAIRAELEQQWEVRVREAEAAAFRDGEARGRTKAAGEIQPVMERLMRSIEEIAGLRGRFRRQAEEDLLRLAFTIARRILRRELAIDPDAMRGLVLAALEKLQAHEIFRVKAHPTQAEAMDTMLKSKLPGSSIQIIRDPACDPGTVIFETDRGSLDASVDTQLQEIERGLTDRLGAQR